MAEIPNEAPLGVKISLVALGLFILFSLMTLGALVFYPVIMEHLHEPEVSHRTNGLTSNLLQKRYRAADYRSEVMQVHRYVGGAGALLVGACLTCSFAHFLFTQYVINNKETTE